MVIFTASQRETRLSKHMVDGSNNQGLAILEKTLGCWELYTCFPSIDLNTRWLWILYWLQRWCDLTAEKTWIKVLWAYSFINRRSVCACACWKLKWNPGNVRKNHGCLRGGSSFSTTLRPKNGTEPLWVLFFFQSRLRWYMCVMRQRGKTRTFALIKPIMAVWVIISLHLCVPTKLCFLTRN